MNIPHLRGSGRLGKNRPDQSRFWPGGQRWRTRLVPQARMLFRMLHCHLVAMVGHRRPDRAATVVWNPERVGGGFASSRILEAVAPTRAPPGAANSDTTRTRWAMHLTKDGSDARWEARLDGDYRETVSLHDSSTHLMPESRPNVAKSFFFFLRFCFVVLVVVVCLFKSWKSRFIQENFQFFCLFVLTSSFLMANK